MLFFRIFLVCLAAAVVLLFLDGQANVLSSWGRRYTGGVSSLRSSSTTLNKEPDLMKEQRPPLSSLIGDKEANITGNVEFLLDWAIIAHPKTGTSFTLNWFASHPEIEAYTYEIHSLQQGKPALFVSQLYDLPAGSQYKRGYKSPRDLILIQSLQSLRKYWPDTRLVVGLRHPVTWFESFYNFRVRQNYTMPPPETLDGRCHGKLSNGVCAEEALFHIHLSMLGKTSMTDPDEIQLLQSSPKRRPPPMRNKVFLYEISQLHDSDQYRLNKYRRDLSNFLGLHQDLAPLGDSRDHPNYKYVLDICLPKYKPLRGKLMKIARASSIWIRDYFLPHPDVVVSSPQHFNELLLQWLEDPCELEEPENEDERRRRLLMWE